MLHLLGSRGSSIDETRFHHGEEVNKEDETVMDSEQGSSTFALPTQGRKLGDAKNFS